MTAPTLNPCPWSGDGPGLHPVVHGVVLRRDSYDRFFVFCRDCAAQGPLLLAEAKAILAWNAAGDKMRMDLAREIDGLKAEVERLRARRAVVCGACCGDGSGERNQKIEAATCEQCHGTGAVLADKPGAEEG